MKKFILLLLIPFISAAFTAPEIPAVNKKIVDYAKSMIGKKVDRGECWDLVAYALNKADADWKSPEGFGKKLNPKKEKLLPGDVIEFKNVTIETEYSKGTFGQHYGLVYEVVSENVVKMAHQNFNNNRTVQLFDLDISTVVKGDLNFYRPQQKN